MDFHQTHLYLFLENIFIHKFAHHLCSIDIIISPQIIFMLLSFDTQLWFLGKLHHDQCHVWHHLPFAMQYFYGGVKMVVLSFCAFKKTLWSLFMDGFNRLKARATSFIYLFIYLPFIYSWQSLIIYYNRFFFKIKTSIYNCFL